MWPDDKKLLLAEVFVVRQYRFLTILSNSIGDTVEQERHISLNWAGFS